MIRALAVAAVALAFAGAAPASLGTPYTRVTNPSSGIATVIWSPFQGPDVTVDDCSFLTGVSLCIATHVPGTTRSATLPALLGWSEFRVCGPDDLSCTPWAWIEVQ